MSQPTQDELRLIEKLRRIDALFSGATTAGERDAAEAASKRIQARLRKIALTDPPVEHRFKLADQWSQRVFVALLRRYEIEPYRYPRQRRTTIMARVSRQFVNETLWPEFEELSATLREHLSDVTTRIVTEVLHKDNSEPVERALP